MVGRFITYVLEEIKLIQKNLPLLMNLAYSGYNRGLDGGDLSPKDGETFCNVFIQSICSGIGYGAFSGMNANEMVHKMQLETGDWISVSDPVAQNHANDGVLVIAGWNNPIGHGHVNLIIPGILEPSFSFGKSVPRCANVGKDVFFGKKISFAFTPTNAPAYYALVSMI